MSRDSSVNKPRYYSARILSVIEGFQRDNNSWLPSTDIHRYVPELTKPQLHNLVSSLVNTEGILARQQTVEGRAGFEYQLAPDFVTYKSPTPVPAQPVVPVTLLKEGESAERKYVKWKDKEKWDIAQAVAAFRKDSPVGVVEAVNAVQPMMIEAGVLPAKQRRMIHNISGLQWLFPLLERADKKLGKTAAVPQKAAETPAVTPPVQQAAPLPNGPKAAAVPLSTGMLIDMLLTRFQQSATKVLADAIDYGVTRAFKNIVESAQGQKLLAQVGTPRPTPQPVKHNPTPEQEERTRLTRVLVAGLRPPERAPILDEFKGALDLRIWCEGESTQSLREMSKVADKTVLIINRLSHPEKDIIGRRDVVYVEDNNGPRGVKEALTKIFADS